jgi:hypothetical protein
MNPYKFNATMAQAQTLRRLYDRVNLQDRPNYLVFLSTVQPGWDCLMVPLWGMWIGIERDGYTHS